MGEDFQTTDDPSSVRRGALFHWSRREFMIAGCALLVDARALRAADQASGDAEPPIEPRETIALLNGRDLSAWYSWLDDEGYEDPRQVFHVQDDGILRISGEGFGGLVTRQAYANYHLVVEYRWGTATWRSRKEAARAGGLLLHCQGPDGNFGGAEGRPGPWMTSIECQIIEGGVGDILVLSGTDADGKSIPAEATCTVVRDRDGEPTWFPQGVAERFTKGRINWFGRDPDWEDRLGVRGPQDPDAEGQGWTRLECFASDDALVYRVNGVIVNRAARIRPSTGKILLQTEGAEMFVRKLELRPLPSELPE